jgi:hypothetical protein
MTTRKRLAYWLRTWADRIDHEGAPKLLAGWTFTFEKHRGIVVRFDGRGCRIAVLGYLGDTEREKAHSESDTEEAERADREKTAAWLDEIERDGDERQRAAAAQVRQMLARD